MILRFHSHALLVAALLGAAQAAVTCPRPGTGPSQPLPAGRTITINPSNQDQVCLLSKLTTLTEENGQTKTYLAPAGRSYNGRQWETTAGAYAATLKFNCAARGCVVTLPELDDPESSFVLTTYAHTATPEQQVSRFLQQTTFGPTRADMKSWNATDFGAWMQEQMYETEPTLHRAYFRKRANARMSWLYDGITAPGDKPCDLHARYKTYAFGWEEMRAFSWFQLTKPNNSTEWFLIKDANGYPRTEVPQATWAPYLSPGKWFTYCFAEEREGGIFNVRVNGVCINIESGNPKIQFHETLPRNLVHLPDDAMFKVVDQLESQGSEMILSEAITSPVCDTLVAGGGVPVHAINSENTTWYLHDPRVAMVDNTVDAPVEDGGGANMLGRDTLCSNVPRTFLNSDQCHMSTDPATCSPYTTMDVSLQLNDATLVSFFKLARRYIYVLNMTEPISTPCAIGSKSRWKKMDTNICTTTIPDAATKTTIEALLAANTDRNPFVKDINFPQTGGGTCLATTPKGVKIKVAGICWQHVHDDENNIYDFTNWVNLHPGGKPAITQFATRGEAFLNFPFYKDSSHTQDRWTTNKNTVKYVGRYGDALSFKDLPVELRVESVADKYGAVGATASGAGVMVCGSPGEIANDPEMGDEFDLGMDARWDKTNSIQDFEAQKFSVWNTIVVYSKDQLRQRMAWALSQILTMAVGDIDEPDETEIYLNYYDIFVRNAFGNYRDILKEVAFSPMMAEMLTYLESKSTGYAAEALNLQGVFPDENFAREILQLFSIGLVKLNMDGTPVTRADGTIEQSYTNLDVMDNARAWTGFSRQTFRGNIESLSNRFNRIDPMRVYPEWRDAMPKADIYGGYIGDGFPLCVDLPEKQFLKIGAKYRLLGNNPTPELQYDPADWTTKSTKRVVLNTTSSLYQTLCNAPAGQACDFQAEVTLDTNLACSGMECTIDQPRVVELSLQGKKVYYEYIRPPCVQFPFYSDALKIKGRGINSVAMCADPRLPAAEEACCNKATLYNSRGIRNCAYTGERVTYPTARQRCQAVTSAPHDVCTWRVMGTDAADCGANSCCTFEHGFHWSNAECEISVKVDKIGQIAVVHNHTDLDTATGEMRGSITGAFAPNNPNFFRVHWRHDAFPSTDGSSSCSGQCKPSKVDDSCVCTMVIVEDIAFSDLPPAEKALDLLKIGAVHPSAKPCVILESGENIKAWDCSGSGVIDEETVFEITRKHLPTVYRKNTYSAVRINNGAFEFRNPPTFISPWERDNVRDVVQETDAVLDQVFYHPNTAPFVALRLIQRFGISNPSPAYREAVAIAFADGTYTNGETSFGTGDYGDLAATAAAILLHPEARAVVLDADPSYGSVREPLLRVMHLFRTLEYQPNLDYYPHIKTISMDTKIGQMAHAIPSVFSFFLPDFLPPGRLNAASLYSPEAGMTNTPMIIGLLGGMFSLIKYKLAECYSGFGPEGTDCGKGVGGLTYEAPKANDLDAAIKELNLLLTAGRLTKGAVNIIKDAAVTGENFQQQLEIVQQLIVTSPEFNTNTVVERADLRYEPPPPQPSTKEHKSIVFFMMSGGMDSYNLLVPSNSSCPDLFRMYNNTRGAITMTDAELSAPFSAGGTQPTCDQFKLHKEASAVTSLYNSGEAILFANTGILLEPVTQADWEEKHRETVLFAHDRQQRETKMMDPFQDVAGTGVLGRMTDSLTRNGYKIGSLSIEGGTEALAGEDGVGPLIKYLSRNGATKFDPVPTSSKILPSIKKINNNTAFDSSMFGDLWSANTINALAENEEFVKALDSVTLDHAPKFDPRPPTAQKMEIVAKLIKGHDIRGTDRDVFWVELGGWDVHSDAKARTAGKVNEMNAALDGFAKEMKAQGKWNSTVVVMLSEFGRTMTANSGGGCDHGWGGNYFIAGGAVAGGKILGEYPTNYDELDVSRARVYPTTPFDAIWNGVAEWFGVPAAEMDTVLPNRGKFNNLFDKADLFK